MAKAGNSGRKRLAEGLTFGRYVLIEELGAGGMGVVYAALDPDLHRKVALKLIRRDHSDAGRAESDSARLLREARAMAKLHHPNVVTVHDVGTIDGNVFVAMEYVDGATLKQWLERGPHPHARMLEVMLRAAQGLIAAHEAGIIHRDFKPDNVLLGRDDAVKVLDFGLARPPDAALARERSDEPAPKEFRTRVGIVLGTPLYMSPEQHRGLALDERSDQFSFCVVLYEALYGQRPFTGRNRHAVAMQACKGVVAEIPDDSQVPAHIRAAVARGLQPEPDDRWPSMQALLEALTTDPVQRRKRLALSAGAVAMGLLGMVALMWPRAAADPCPAEVDAAAAGWGDTSAALRDRIARANADGAWAATSAETATGLAEGWLQGWREERSETCQASRVRHDQSDARGEARARCLAQQLDTAVDVLERAAPEHAVEAASNLPDPRSCREDARLNAIMASAQPGENASASAHAQLELALREATQEQPEKARANAEAAAQSAIGLGDPELAVRAWILQSQLDTKAARPDLARRWLRYADAELSHLSHPAPLKAQLHAAWTRLESAAGNHERALDHATAALDTWRELTGSEHVHVAAALAELAATLDAAGRSAEANAPHEEALRMREALLGPGHPALTEP